MVYKNLSESLFLASTIDAPRIIITDIQLGYLGCLLLADLDRSSIKGHKNRFNISIVGQIP